MGERRAGRTRMNARQGRGNAPAITVWKEGGREHAAVRLDAMAPGERERYGERARGIGEGLAPQGARIEVVVSGDTLRVSTDGGHTGAAKLIACCAALADEVARASGAEAPQTGPVRRWTPLDGEGGPHLWMAGWRGAVPAGLARAASSAPGARVWPEGRRGGHLDLGDGTRAIAAIVPDRAAAERLCEDATLERAVRCEREEAEADARALARWRALRAGQGSRQRFGVEIGGARTTVAPMVHKLVGPKAKVRMSSYNAEAETPIGEAGESAHWIIEAEPRDVREAWRRAHLARALEAHLESLEIALAQGGYATSSVSCAGFGNPEARELALSAVTADHDSPEHGYESALCAAASETLARIEDARWLGLTHFGWTPAPISVGYAGAPATAYLGWLGPGPAQAQWAEPAVVNAAIERTARERSGEPVH